MRRGTTQFQFEIVSDGPINPSGVEDIFTGNKKGSPLISFRQKGHHLITILLRPCGSYVKDRRRTWRKDSECGEIRDPEGPGTFSQWRFNMNRVYRVLSSRQETLSVLGETLSLPFNVRVFLRDWELGTKISYTTRFPSKNKKFTMDSSLTDTVRIPILHLPSQDDHSYIWIGKQKSIHIIGTIIGTYTGTQGSEKIKKTRGGNGEVGGWSFFWIKDDRTVIP